jgi:putative hydrolase of the HAD superfamily
MRAVLLDLDDTLYDRGAAFESWARAKCAELGDADLATLRRFDGRGHRPRADFAADARAILEVDPVRFSFELAEHLTPEPDVRDTLVELARTHRVAIVTNGGPAQRVKLAKLGIADIPHAIFVSGELGFAKPDPRVFTTALKWSEVAAADALFVGDEPLIDLAPAAALGMRTAWRVRADWPAHLASPTHRITRIAQLLELA